MWTSCAEVPGTVVRNHLSGLKVSNQQLSVSPRTLQEASSATQQWNELVKD